MPHGNKMPIFLLLWMTAFIVLTSGCANGPRDQSVITAPFRLPDLEPMVAAQEPDFTQTMDCFLQGKLMSGSASDCSATPVMPPTQPPKKQ